MASENKKRKAKNSYLHNGNEAQKIHKLIGEKIRDWLRKRGL